MKFLSVDLGKHQSLTQLVMRASPYLSAFSVFICAVPPSVWYPITSEGVFCGDVEHITSFTKGAGNARLLSSAPKANTGTPRSMFPFHLNCIPETLPGGLRVPQALTKILSLEPHYSLIGLDYLLPHSPAAPPPLPLFTLPRRLQSQKPVTSFVSSRNGRWLQPSASCWSQDVFIRPPRTPEKCFWQEKEEGIRSRYTALHSEGPLWA